MINEELLRFGENHRTLQKQCTRIARIFAETLVSKEAKSYTCQDVYKVSEMIDVTIISADSKSITVNLTISNQDDKMWTALAHLVSGLLPRQIPVELLTANTPEKLSAFYEDCYKSKESEVQIRRIGLLFELMSSYHYKK